MGLVDRYSDDPSTGSCAPHEGSIYLMTVDYRFTIVGALLLVIATVLSAGCVGECSASARPTDIHMECAERLSCPSVRFQWKDDRADEDLVVHCANGKVQGPVLSYTNGTLRHVIHLANAVPFGQELYFFPSGHLSSEHIFDERGRHKSTRTFCEPGFQRYGLSVEADGTVKETHYALDCSADPRVPLSPPP